MSSLVGSLSNVQVTLLAAVVSALLSALIAAIVSIFTARYAIKHGPNYDEQIEGLHETIGSLAKTQEELRKQQAEQAQWEAQRYEAQEKKAEAQRWKPTAKIVPKTEGNVLTNYLHLQSSVEFAVIEASLLTKTGGKIDDYRTEGSKLTSKGFSIPLTHASLVKLMNVSDSYFQRSTFEGLIRFLVLRDGHETEGTIPFHAEMVSIGNTSFPKLNG